MSEKTLVKESPMIQRMKSRRASNGLPPASGHAVWKRRAGLLRAGVVLLVPVCAVILGFALTADADNAYPKITISEAGPDSPIPFNAPFYLVGDADKEADRVQAVIVRKGSRRPFADPGPRCYEVRDGVLPLMDVELDPGITAPSHLLADVKKARKSLLLPDLSGLQETTFSEKVTDDVLVTQAWKPPKSETEDAGPAKSTGGIVATITINVGADATSVTTNPDGGSRAVGSSDAGSSDDSGAASAVTANVSAPSPPSAKTPSFKVFVPASNEFFVPGLNYCLLLFKHTSRTTVTPVEDLMKALFDKGRSCDTARVACGDTAPCVKVYDACRASARTSLQEAIRDRLDKAKGRPGDPKQVDADLEKQVKAVESKLSIYFHVISGLATEVEAVDRFMAAGNWRKVTDPGYLDEKSLEDALLLLVKRQDQLASRAVEAPAAIQILDREQIAVTRKSAPDAKPAAAAKKAPPGSDPPPVVAQPPEIMSMSKLLLPDGKVSVRDLLELALGRISLDGTSYLEVAEVRKLLATVLDVNNTPAYAPQALATLHAVESRLRILDVAVRHLVDLPPSTSVSRVESAIERAFSKWLTPVLVYCAPVPPISCEPALPPAEGQPAPPRPNRWPDYPRFTSPLTAIADALSNLEKHHDALAKAIADGATAITETIQKSTLQVVAMPERQVSERLWVSSYITPVAGAMIALPRGSSTIIAPYVGFQLHFTPNNIDDPLWTHGHKDWTRFAALELGLGTNPGPYGTDGRFRGPGAFAPVLLGATIHPIPYTSATGGLSIFDQRSSTLPQQQYQATVVRFFAVSVVANLPDLARAVINNGSATTNISGVH